MTRIAIYPGTFDPIQFGHIDIATRAATMFDELVFAIYDRPDKRLLFTVAERAQLASDALGHIPNIRVVPYSGLTVNFARQVGASTIVRGLRVIPDFELEYQMALTNRQLAPDIESICLMTRQEHTFLSSTIVKQIALLGGNVSGMVPPHVEAALRAKRDEQEGYESFV
ncbi:MAG: pantetheine-phosphate adenylyltransferase [Chloroflexi bacterium]|nr:pantetheine-phosphate adenylyltransferase [Chloroflexota bacterium]